MKTTAKVLRAILATFAVMIVITSSHAQQIADPGDRSALIVMGILVFLSVAFLHWLLVRYVTAADLIPSTERHRLSLAAETGYQRSFFRGTVGIGYILIAGYAMDVTGFGFHSDLATSLGYLCTGIVFLFLGLVARARGVILALLNSKHEQPQPIA